MISTILLMAGILFLPPQTKNRKDPERKGPRISLQLVREAKIRGNQILLGDIARIQCTDRLLRDKLENTPLGPAPVGNWARWISPKEILENLGRLNLDPRTIRIKGYRRVQVFAAQERIPAQEIIQAAETTLREALKQQNETDATWRVMGKPRSVIVPIGRKSRILQAKIPGGKVGPNSAFLRVDILVDDKVVSSVPITFQIQRFGEAVVLLRDLKRGEPIDASVLTTKRVQIKEATLDPFREISQLKDLVASRNLRQGTILKKGDVQKPFVIRRGEIITVVAMSGTIKVTTRGIAQRDGVKGAVIPVLLVGKREPIFTTVYGVGLALAGTKRSPRLRKGY
ncbi:MAG TPA: flagellar basal body P-ring formation protein FlgA [Planctomycetes bacterium]|nr:flagellar basal body P-ring formation protein FlgA [Planctomycetota bacterium]